MPPHGTWWNLSAPENSLILDKSTSTAGTIPRHERDAVAYCAPFVVFIGCLALERMLPLSPALLYPLRFLLVLGVMIALSRHVIPWRPSQWAGSTIMGVLVFVIWVGPDILWPQMRSHWLFQNAITGSAAGQLPGHIKNNAVFVTTRVLGSIALVPVLEELFWRGFLWRWLMARHFQKVPIGTYSAFAFWTVAVLFASEHGPYWDVGLLAGIAYNWWLVRTRNLADCILAHSVTNACLAVYVLARNQWQYWL